MAISKAKKTEVYTNLSEKIKGSSSVVFVNFHGLPVSEANMLRKTLKGGKAGYTVAKKTLLARALRDAGIAGTEPELLGEVAMAYGADQVLPAKEVSAFAKTHKDSFKILGGVLDGAYVSAAQVTALAAIPSREVLLAKLLGTLNAPVTNFVGVLAAVPRSFVVALSEISKKKAA